MANGLPKSPVTICVERHGVGLIPVELNHALDIQDDYKENPDLLSPYTLGRYIDRKTREDQLAVSSLNRKTDLSPEDLGQRDWVLPQKPTTPKYHVFVN